MNAVMYMKSTARPCVTAWDEWSQCDGCTQRRSRKCDATNPECNNQCNKSLEQTRVCGNCTSTTAATTPSSTMECDENEEYKSCSSRRSRCENTCMAFRLQNDTCMEEEEEEPCQPACHCVEGFYRNNENKCVPSSACECYPPGKNSSVPAGYREEVDEQCRECMCEDDGYKCFERPDCCKFGPWTSWTPCSATCGEGSKSRSRPSFGDCSGNDELVNQTIACDVTCECEVTYREQIGCKDCKCEEGLIVCKPITCPAVTGCNNDTHVLIDDPEQTCCKTCVEIKKPCRKIPNGTVRLNFSSETLGRCISVEEVTVEKCQGVCEDSFETTRYVGNSITMVRDSKACSCCRADLGSKTEQFRCGEDEEYVTLTIPTVSGCVCNACDSGTQ